MSSPVKTVSILGVTGSVGRAAADVILSAPERFDVQAVTANTDAVTLAAMAKNLKACCAVIADDGKFGELKELLSGTGIEAQAGVAALNEAASRAVDLALAAIVGLAGLRPLLAAIKHSRCVAIANKEPLVAAGALVMAAAKENNTVLLPVDSEHNAVFQVFDFERPDGVEKIILTASGGPFRTWSAEQMRGASVAQALAHPNWVMGKKISIDSATMMNKALEVIEAHHLFNMPAEKIEVLVHPESLIHSMVEYKDGSVLAQMGASDMRTPLAHVLAWPERMNTPGRTLDFATIKTLTFEAPPDRERFPALPMAYDALKAGAPACVAFNAANEVAVEAFLQHKIGFLGILGCICRIMENSGGESLNTVEDIMSYDQSVRRVSRDYILQGLTDNTAVGL